ncbi:RagB/SusD family nutrient uptake outer membrane protein [Maribellus sp. CM-23]|uniref:RagB/SusD family nutrient uptake outer membrane protein n=1 Tax=Maribellus sp. CM-23 TaxID=2781026 RepID=UPI001F3C934C|nr:RagB/SusD family nutrient uptake outer membrane protein [Maribellus sp. CM-23]MCE4566077.1 RagB/SusD family nutrient uptake outer membrane protein [Maribellus sp. CM-23]
MTFNKRYLNYLSGILLFSALLFTSCEDQLSTDPEDRVVPQTVDDYHAVMVGGLPKVYHAFTDLMTDDVIAKNYTTFNNPSVYSEWSLAYLWIDQRATDEASSPEYAWRWYYADIYKQNLVIANVMDAEGDKNFAASILGESLLLRAYSYFTLVNLFGKHYDPATAETDLGVPVLLEPLEAGFHYFKRNTVAEVYEQIEKDMLKGLELINDAYIEKPKFHFTKVSALAFASRFYLYTGDYQKTIEYSNQSWEINSTLLDHNDFPNSDLGEVFEPLPHANSYFTDDRENVLLIRPGYFAVNYMRSGYYANEFMRIYEYRDLRGKQNFSFTNTSMPNYITLKLSLSYQQFNFPLFRTEEVLLNRAEAYAKLGGDDNKANAIRDLNTLRQKRFHPDYYVPYRFSDFRTQQDMVDGVLLERRKELCYEGHRWFDLKRNGAPEIVHYFNGEKYVLEQNDLRYVLQIPDNELINNPEIEKNPR